jgi:hypothetical protein
MAFVVILVCAASICLYFIPALAGRNKKNRAAIFWLNFLLGWTMVGWIVALVWALTKDAEAPQPVIVNQTPALSSVLCPHCGKYSPSATQFCGMCGKAMAASPNQMTPVTR